jgi:hypothetical protein
MLNSGCPKQGSEACLAQGLPLPRPEREREQAAPRRVTLTESEERSRSGGEHWKREGNDGWESWQGSRVQIPQSGGTWGQFNSLGSGEGRTQRPRERPQTRASC